MTTTDYIQNILAIKKEAPCPEAVDEAAAYEAAQLITGNFTYPLYGELWKNFIDMDDVTEHLENLYDSANHFGLVYFIVMLADSVGYTLPIEFVEMSAKDALVPVLSASVIEDWLEYDGSFEATEYEG